MKVTDLNQAEELVKINPHLSWDGWNIVLLKEDEYAEFLSSGYFDRNTEKWYRRQVFPCKDNGWNIPDSVLTKGQK